jgi:hypothetical protein
MLLNRITASFMTKESIASRKRRKAMLNIFADALLVATRLGRASEDYLPRHHPRRSPREFQDDEGLRTADHLRHMGR